MCVTVIYAFTEFFLQIRMNKQISILIILILSCISKLHAAKTVPIKESVEPLVETRWGQHDPYNYMISHYNTGCTATAMAQIVNYHKFPEVGFGYHTYEEGKYGTIDACFAYNQYVWDYMPIDRAECSERQRHEVSILMAHCCAALNTQYWVSGGAMVETADSLLFQKAFSRFGYDSVRHVLQKDYTSEEWENLFKAELSAGRPFMLLAAYDTIDSIVQGHTIVVDGYNEQGEFHLNFGWDGIYDGYYPLSDIKNKRLEFFPDMQEAVINIYPNYEHKRDERYQFSVTQLSVSDTAFAGGELALEYEVQNGGTEPVDGILLPVAFGENNDEYFNLLDCIDTCFIEGGQTYKKQFVHKIDNSIVNGDYYVKLVFFTEVTDDTFHFIPNSATATNQADFVIANKPIDSRLITAASDNVKVIAQPNGIAIKGAKTGSPIKIYNLLGHEIYSGSVTEHQNIIALSPNIYLVQVGNQVHKAVVR